MRRFVKWSAVLDRSFCSYLDKKLVRVGVNSSQHFYILRICESPGITQDTLLEVVHRDPSNVTRALALLEKRGYLKKETGQKDKRTYHLYPTKMALEVYDEIRAIVGESIEEALMPLSMEEREVFMQMLEKTALHVFMLNKKEKTEPDREKGSTYV